MIGFGGSNGQFAGKKKMSGGQIPGKKKQSTTHFRVSTIHHSFILREAAYPVCTSPVIFFGDIEIVNLYAKFNINSYITLVGL